MHETVAAETTAVLPFADTITMRDIMGTGRTAKSVENLS
jgi:hypothetical protein